MLLPVLLGLSVSVVQYLYDDIRDYIDVVPYTPEQRVRVAQSIRNVLDVISIH